MIAAIVGLMLIGAGVMVLALGLMIAVAVLLGDDE
jgi:hypothetical protein